MGYCVLESGNNWMRFT